MKKLIAAAIAILIGSVGYTVVDKTTDERISTLESQVASLEELHNNETETTCSKEYSSTNIFDDEPDELQKGDFLILHNQKYLYKFYFEDSNIYRVPTFQDSTYNDFDISKVTTYDLNFTNVSVQYLGFDSEPYTAFDSNYSIKTYDRGKYKFHISANGYVLPQFNGLTLNFYLDLDGDVNDFEFTSTVNSDGTFSISEDFEWNYIPTVNGILFGNKKRAGHIVTVD